MKASRLRSPCARRNLDKSTAISHRPRCAQEVRQKLPSAGEVSLCDALFSWSAGSVPMSSVRKRALRHLLAAQMRSLAAMYSTRNDTPKTSSTYPFTVRHALLRFDVHHRRELRRNPGGGDCYNSRSIARRYFINAIGSTSVFFTIAVRHVVRWREISCRTRIVAVTQKLLSMFARSLLGLWFLAC